MMKQLIGILSFYGSIHAAFAQFEYVNPIPGSAMHNPGATIILKNGDPISKASVENEKFIEINGSISGKHEWVARLSDDGRTIVVIPNHEFSYGEMVFITVFSKLRKHTDEKIEGISYTFRIRDEITPEQREQYQLARLLLNQENEPSYLAQDKSDDIKYPLDSMPTFKILVNNNPALGQIFYTSQSADPITGDINMNSISTIINNDGSIVWARDIGAAGYDFKLNESGYLTHSAPPNMWMIIDSNFNFIDTVQCVNGYEDETNSHDMIMTPDNHVFVMAYNIQTVDMTPYGGLPDASVMGLILQELDSNRDLVFEWRSWDHFLFTDANSYTSLTNATLDYVHCNSIEKDYDGNILISCRNMNELTKINHETGDIIWRMGGENNQFTFVNDNIPEHFHSQHDLRRLSNGNITIYNNGNQLPILISSAKEYALDEENKVATLVWYYEHPDVDGNHVYSGTTGSVQRLTNGNTLIDWGITTPSGKSLPNFTEVDMNKNIVWEMAFDSAGYKSYRAHKYEWRPCSRITGYTMNVAGNASKITLSWGPATGASKYEVYYRKLGSSSWTLKKTNLRKIHLKNLTAMTAYEWRVKTICSPDGSLKSAFSSLDTFKVKQLKYATVEIDNQQKISVYPVPASEFITIQLSQPMVADITINDILGNLRYKEKIDYEGANEIRIDVASWSPGMYLLTVKNELGSESLKFILQ